MIKVAVHIRDTEEKAWTGHKFIELTRVPSVGEYISFEIDNSPGYEIKFVNHYAYKHDDGVEAEVFVMPAKAEKTSWEGWQN